MHIIKVYDVFMFVFGQNRVKFLFRVNHFLRAKAECFARLCHRLGVCLSVRLSVRLSVTLVICIKTVQARIRNLHCGLPQGL